MAETITALPDKVGRTQANTASLLLRAGHCSGGSSPVKRHFGTMVCRHIQGRAASNNGLYLTTRELDTDWSKVFDWHSRICVQATCSRWSCGLPWVDRLRCWTSWGSISSRRRGSYGRSDPTCSWRRSRLTEDSAAPRWPSALTTDLHHI